MKNKIQCLGCNENSAILKSIKSLRKKGMTYDVIYNNMIAMLEGLENAEVKEEEKKSKDKKKTK